ncbi:unnamed protein product [Albugo candida]|uniref:Uncharacterized protein n=1 Tax=Albugo candida TaxID=65357 RepID=A0A024G7N5_9STRA|nr:unnamed protein product [Albugo candida]|eukprot:CCI42560.1 unnamed protein product [Albugo candida]
MTQFMGRMVRSCINAESRLVDAILLGTNASKLSQVANDGLFRNVPHRLLHIRHRWQKTTTKTIGCNQSGLMQSEHKTKIQYVLAGFCKSRVDTGTISLINSFLALCNAGFSSIFTLRAFSGEDVSLPVPGPDSESSQVSAKLFVGTFVYIGLGCAFKVS